MTLIELLVIVAILGILAAILLPAVHRAGQERPGGAATDTGATGGVVEPSADAGARETAAAIKGFVVGVVATVIVGALWRRRAGKLRQSKQ